MASTDTVTVACKLPSGLVLENFDPKTKARQTVTLNGSRFRINRDGAPIFSHEIAHGAFGLTHNVPADFWNTWAAQNAAYPPFVKGHIFALAKVEDTRAAAKEMAGVKTGFEPLSRDKLPAKLEAAPAA